MNAPSGSAKIETVPDCPDAVVTKSKRARGGLKNQDCSPLELAPPPVAVSLYVTLYSVALAAVRTCPKEGPVAPGVPVAAPGDPGALVAVAPAVVDVVVVEPPHDTTIIVNARRSALPSLTTRRR
jgi:hypothetical protein